MKFPNTQIEKQLWQEGFAFIAGTDEAGRGAWAGPIVGGAVILDPKIKINGLRDSKLLSEKSREKLYEIIAQKAVAFGLGIISREIIDKKGLGFANRLALTTALDNLGKSPNYVLVDALKIEYKNLPIKAVIDGDYKIASIAAASIMAKVTRDRIMIELGKKYPAWGFEKHKGYGTKKHLEMISQFGICRQHRQSFMPIKNLLK